MVFSFVACLFIHISHIKSYYGISHLFVRQHFLKLNIFHLKMRRRSKFNEFFNVHKSLINNTDKSSLFYFSIHYVNVKENKVFV